MYYAYTATHKVNRSGFKFEMKLDILACNDSGTIPRQIREFLWPIVDASRIPDDVPTTKLRR